MRRHVATGVLLAAAALLPSGVAAHPGHGPEVIYLRDLPNRFDPGGELTVAVGDYVFWRWGGQITNRHSVTADDGSFDSGIQDAAEHVFDHRFTREGRFPYHCRVHPEMTGTINVIALTGADLEAPRLSRARVVRVAGAPQLRFRLSERADVLVRVRRRGRTLRVFDMAGSAGANRRRVPTGGLAAGRYRLVLTAFDLADNRSRNAVARLRLH